MYSRQLTSISTPNSVSSFQLQESDPGQASQAFVELDPYPRLPSSSLRVATEIIQRVEHPSYYRDPSVRSTPSVRSNSRSTPIVHPIMTQVGTIVRECFAHY